MRVACPYCRHRHDVDNNQIGSRIICDACGRAFSVSDLRGGIYLLSSCSFRITAAIMVFCDGWHDQHMLPWMWGLCALLIVLSFVYNIAYIVRFYSRRKTAVIPFRVIAVGTVDTVGFGVGAVILLMMAISHIG